MLPRLAVLLLLSTGASAAGAQTPPFEPTPTPAPPADAPVPEPPAESSTPTPTGTPGTVQEPVAAPPAPTPTPGAEASPEATPTPGPPRSPTPSGPPEPDRSAVFPNINVYLPEGRADIRFLKPIRNSLFENEIDYNFVSGDISAFLRYKYYGRSQTSTLTFFDTIEFEELERFSNEFSRTRGALYLQRRPLNFYNRFYWLVEFDRLTFSRPIDHPDANRTNTYTKVGYQFGTPSDERSNAVVGEARDRLFDLFTAYREIGPRGRGVSVAATWGADFLGGDYRYVKMETEALQGIDLGNRNRIVLRLHGGFFPYKKRVREEFDPLRGTPFSVPRYELFKLNGRNELKGYRGSERGPNHAHLTTEYVTPLFTERPRRFLGLDWHHLYLIGYAGAGNVGNDSATFTELTDYKVDVGLGFESAIYWKRYRAFVSFLAAKAVVNGFGDPRFLFTIRTYR